MPLFQGLAGGYKESLPGEGAMTDLQSMMTPQLLTTLFVIWSLVAIPSAVILKRLGQHPAWALLCYVPAFALIGLWVLAFAGRGRSAA